MIKNILFSLSALLPFTLVAQVQVSKEPLHKKVLENNYIRLLDVWVKPGDTTQFHVHSLPSVFLHFTTSSISTQVKGKEWIKDQNTEGKLLYKPFGKDSIIHRVTNCDTKPYHVTDMELLSAYESRFPFHVLPFPIILDNDRVIGYRLDQSSFSEHINSTHGPMLAQLVKGHEVTYTDIVTKKSITIKEGKYLYIPPGNTFQFSTIEDEAINLVLIEIK
jgi:quercetin dioxygenase-like cupin family protein